MTKTRYIPTGYTRDNITSYYEGREQNLFEVYTNTENERGPKAIFFTGKQSKPTWHYQFTSTSDMVKKIKESIDRVTSWEDAKAKRKADRKAPHTLKVGDILYTSWGYDQTNIDFYQVTKVIGSNTVEIREVASKNIGSDYVYENRVLAVKDAFLSPRYEGDDQGVPMTKRVTNNQVKVTSYASARLWDGQPKYETAAGFGH